MILSFMLWESASAEVL